MRTVIAVVVGVIIAALTAIAIFVTSASFQERARKDAESQIGHAYLVVPRLEQLDAIDISNKVERLAADQGFINALAPGADSLQRSTQSDQAFRRFTSDSPDTAPDILALVDATGNVVAMNGGNSLPKQWKNEKGEVILPALAAALGKRVIISDIWDYQGGMMKVAVAPVVNLDAVSAAGSGSGSDATGIIGAVVIAYSQTAKAAQRAKAVLGTEIAYYINDRVVATSFTRGASAEEDTSKAKQLADTVKAIKPDGKSHKIDVDGSEYLATNVVMPRIASKALPPGYPTTTAGAILLEPTADTNGTAGTVKLFIGILGIGSLAISLLGLFLMYRRLMGQVDQIEIGVAEIINGNRDRTFRPVGAELDGLANGLNVMLARLFGRPEPGDEELDDDGNPVPSSNMEFEDGADDAAATAADPELAALAQEPEAAYYKRVWTEYLAARAAAGTPDDVTFDNFSAKLKVNEGKLKAQYQCKQVRFRVVTKDGKVSLKPVPIFA